MEPLLHSQLRDEQQLTYSAARLRVRDDQISGVREPSKVRPIRETPCNLPSLNVETAALHVGDISPPPPQPRVTRIRFRKVPTKQPQRKWSPKESTNYPNCRSERPDSTGSQVEQDYFILPHVEHHLPDNGQSRHYIHVTQSPPRKVNARARRCQLCIA